jgi:hypothetical protein
VPTRKTKGGKVVAFQPEDLTPQEGKVLRYFVSMLAREEQTPTDKCIVETVWSDLPKTHMAAVRVTGRLKSKGLLAAGEKGHCRATEAGVRLIEAANKTKVWQQAPPPRITNPKLRA